MLTIAEINTELEKYIGEALDQSLLYEIEYLLNLKEELLLLKRNI